MSGVILDLYSPALQGQALGALDSSIAAAPGGGADPVAMHTARRHVATEVARQLRDTFVEIYRSNCRDGAEYVPSTAEKARRALKNSALGYLALLSEDAEVKDIVG